MRASHLSAALLIAGGLSAAAAPAAGGAHDLRPFGRNAVSPEAHAPLGACPFVPEDFLP